MVHRKDRIDCTQCGTWQCTLCGWKRKNASRSSVQDCANCYSVRGFWIATRHLNPRKHAD